MKGRMLVLFLCACALLACAQTHSNEVSTHDAGGLSRLVDRSDAGDRSDDASEVSIGKGELSMDGGASAARPESAEVWIGQIRTPLCEPILDPSNFAATPETIHRVVLLIEVRDGQLRGEIELGEERPDDVKLDYISLDDRCKNEMPTRGVVYPLHDVRRDAEALTFAIVLNEHNQAWCQAQPVTPEYPHCPGSCKYASHACHMLGHLDFNSFELYEHAGMLEGTLIENHAELRLRRAESMP